jgi:protein phosphatase
MYLGFGDECAKRLGEDINDPNSVFSKINEAFEQMPLAAIVTDKQ